MAAQGPEVITDYAATPLYQSIAPSKEAVAAADRAFNTPTSARWAHDGSPADPPTPDNDGDRPQGPLPLPVLLMLFFAGAVLGGSVVFLIMKR